MNLQERLSSFIQLGEKIDSLTSTETQILCENANRQNKWFTEESVTSALKGISKFLKKEVLDQWLSKYQFDQNDQKHVGIVMAGNIPMVGFHDLMCVLLSGHKGDIKPSSDDVFLIKTVSQWLSDINPQFQDLILFPDSLKDSDAIIATGSDNTARYFEHYFGGKPNIIRKNRTSVGVLDGNETEEELKSLGEDIFKYFGLGCRNVSKLFYPKGFDITRIFPSFEPFEPIIHHHKYRNNYDYNKSILLVNKEPHLDTGFLLTKEDEQFVSPISMIYTQSYNDLAELESTINQNAEKIQCIVGGEAIQNTSLEVFNFGEAQYPEVWDYADGVDTMKFLTELK
ncbi:MAG: acyl-CoA reductase [bacterium]|nr:acyl-CoA reductase [bacterium]